MPPDQSEDAAAFYKAMAEQDDLGMIIRGAIHIESKLVEIIEACLFDASALGDMEYSQRVKLAISLGLDPTFKSSLNSIGRLRNKFAHTLKYEIEKDDADAIYQSLNPLAKSITRERYEALSAKRHTGKWPKKFNNLSPRDRCALFLTTIRAALVVAVMQIKRTDYLKSAGGTVADEQS